MKILILSLLSCLVFHSGFAQETAGEIKKNGLVLRAGYANFDKDHNGGFAAAGWEYSFGKYLLAQSVLSFELGQTPKEGQKAIDRYLGVFIDIGIKGKLKIFKKHSLRAGPDVGYSLLIEDRGDITHNTVFFLLTYGYSVSYLIPLNSVTNIGFTYARKYFDKIYNGTQYVGITLIKRF